MVATRFSATVARIPIQDCKETVEFHCRKAVIITKLLKNTVLEVEKKRRSGKKQGRKLSPPPAAKHVVWLLVAHQASLSTGFSKQEYWCTLPFLPTGDLPNPAIEPASPVSPALSGGLFTTSTWEALAAFAQLQFSDPLGCEGKPTAPTPMRGYTSAFFMHKM